MTRPSVIPYIRSGCVIASSDQINPVDEPTYVGDTTEVTLQDDRGRLDHSWDSRLTISPNGRKRRTPFLDLPQFEGQVCPRFGLMSTDGRLVDSTQKPPSHADKLMKRALEIARERLGSVSPRPAVGVVLARGDRIVAAASTEPGSGRHAERAAIEMAGNKTRGADLYVTLEPCAHYGNTPPCSTKIKDAQISRVFAAVEDPNPQSGDGFGQLSAAGIDVQVGLSGREAASMYQGFFKWIETGRPYITAKWAMSLDGKIATNTGQSKYISGEQSLHTVHQMRKETDAIMVGVQTVLSDDPLLTCRLPVGPDFQPLRIVLDTWARTPPNAVMLGDSNPGNTLVVVSDLAAPKQVDRLREAGADIFILPASPRVCLSDVLDELGRRGILNVFVEGGATLLGSFFDAGLVDRIDVFIAPIVLGGHEAPSPVAGEGLTKLADVVKFEQVKVSQSGDDVHGSAVLRTYGPNSS